MWSVSAAVVLAAGIGFACQRGNTCAVATVDDAVFRRSPTRLAALVYAWVIVAGGLAIVNSASPIAVSSAHVTWVCVLGGVLLGAGAVVNGSCTTGTICRVGSGEYKFLMTVVGFFIGCLLAPRVFGRSITTAHAAAVSSTTLRFSWLAIVVGAGALGSIVVRCVRSGEPLRDAIHRPWDPRVASAVIAVLYVTTWQLVGKWSYTDLLGDLARGKVEDVATRVALLLALFLGAVAGGRTQKGPRTIGPLTPHVVRCAIGGTIMGLGFSLTHSAFDGMTFVGQPLLLPIAWVTMIATYAGITSGIVVLRSHRGDRVASRRGTRAMPAEMFSGRPA